MCIHIARHKREHITHHTLHITCYTLRTERKTCQKNAEIGIFMRNDPEHHTRSFCFLTVECGLLASALFCSLARSCRLIVAFPFVGAALGALRLLAYSPAGTGVSLSDPSAVDAVILIRTSSQRNGAKTCCHCALPWLTSVTTHGTCVMIARITQHISLLLRRCSQK